MIPTSQTVLDGTNIRDPTLAFLDTDTYTRTSNGRIEKDVQKQKRTGKRRPSSHHMKRLLALALIEVIRTTLGNHIYQFNWKVYRQFSGGPKGDNISKLAFKVVMFTFSPRYKANPVNLQLSKNTTWLV